MVEYTAGGEGDGAKKVKVFKEMERGKNVAAKGEDLKKGRVILKAWHMAQTP